MADTQFIEANHSAAEKANKLLKKQHLPENIEIFINLYNQSLINVRNESIQEIVSAIVEGYSNIDAKSNKIFVQSKSEVIINQTEFLLKQYKLIATLKRIAQDMIDADYSADTKMILIADKPGFIYLEPYVDSIREEAEELDDSEQVDNDSVVDEITGEQADKVYSVDELELYDGAERFTNSKNTVPNNLFLKAVIKDYSIKDETAYVTVGEMATVSTEPVNALEDFVNSTKELIKDAGDFHYTED